MKLSPEELNLLRQWFNALEDVNPQFLDEADRRLAEKITRGIDMHFGVKRIGDGQSAPSSKGEQT